MATATLLRPNPARANHEMRLQIERSSTALTSASDASVGSSPTPTPGAGGASWIGIDPNDPTALIYYGAVDDGSHDIHIPVSTIAMPDPADPTRILYPLLESLL